jgi:hypothetical protein
MAKLQISKVTSGVRITNLETGAFEDVPVVVADKLEQPSKSSWIDETPIIDSDEPELSGRLHYRA